MSDDEFDLSSGDEEELVAAANVTIEGKRKKEHDSNDAVLEAKRSKPDNGTIATPSPSTVLANKILKDSFRLNSFRLEQQGAITRLLEGGSAVVIFPTGGGKSLCYQVSKSSPSIDIKSDHFRSQLSRSNTKMRNGVFEPSGRVASLWSSHL
jgi:hypothetical protein